MRPQCVPFVATAIAGWFFASAPADAAGLLVPRDGSTPIGIRSHRVAAHVEDGIARTQVRQVFVNPHPRALEAIYSFPLPEDASIVELSMTVAGQRLEGLLVERREARRVYDSLVRKAKDPALLEQVGRNDYRLSVFPVMPQVETVIELTYVEPCPAIAGEVRYVYPLAAQGGSTSIEQDFTAFVDFKTSAKLVAIESPANDLSCSIASEHEGRASLERSKVALDSDLVVVARVEAEAPAMRVHTFRAPSGDAYFAAVITAPQVRDDAVIPRDFTFVLDVSGSMQGEKFAQARRAVRWWIQKLGPRDRANLVLFSDVIRPFAEAPVDATPENRRLLDEFLENSKPGGATDLCAAIVAAGSARPTEGRIPVSVFLTDGRPTVGEQTPSIILKHAREAGEKGVVVHCFGIGDDVDPVLLDGVANSTNGHSEVLRSVGDIEERLRTFLVRIGSPALRGSTLRIDGKAAFDTFPKAPFTIFRGEQFVITGRSTASGETTIEFDTAFDDATITMKAVADFGTRIQEVTSGSIVARDLYAKQRLASLERMHRLRLGLDDAAYHAAVGAGRYDTKDEVVSAMIDVSLETGVQCNYTSFLALLPEDRQRIRSADQDALDEALQRVAERRRILAGSTSSGKDAGAVAASQTDSMDEPADPAPDAAATSGQTGFLMGSGRKAGGGGGGGPTTPGSGPSGGGSRGPTTGGGAGLGKKLSRTDDFSSWQFWWEYNRERFFSNRRENANPNHAIGSTRVERGQVLTRIVPILKSVLGEDDVDIVDSAVLALGRIVETDDAEICSADLVRALGNKYNSVQQSAILALGVLGSKDATPVLIEILNDSAEARQLLRRNGEIPDLHRAFAAIALGYIGSADTIPTLVDTFGSLPAGEKTIRASILVGMGLFPEGTEELIPFLSKTLTDETLDEDTIGQIPIALARLGAESSIPQLVQLVTGNETKVRVDESSILALGMLAGPSDTNVLDALFAKIQDGRNDQSRHFAIIALADIAERALRTDIEGNREFVAGITKRLLWELAKAKHKRHEPWSGLALAMLGRNYPSDAPERSVIAQKLEARFESETNPSYLAAFVLALGILDATNSAPKIQKLMLDTNELELKGFCALSLGMMKHTDAKESLRRYVLDDRDPKFQVRVATALGLMGDFGATDLLIDALRSAKTLNVISSRARAVALLGDARAIDSLEALIRDPLATGLARGFGCVALGLLAEKTEQPWNARIAVGINYRTQVTALKEVLDIH